MLNLPNHKFGAPNCLPFWECTQGISHSYEDSNSV